LPDETAGEAGQPGVDVPANRVGVLGAGLMGSEIAQAVSASGIPVTVVDIDPAALDRGAAHDAPFSEVS
jgi:3-hydroxyisobutyrate dehydrogenase-like beta-hydroxyacid dehydrogenase